MFGLEPVKRTLGGARIFVVHTEPLRKFINPPVIVGDDKKHSGVMGTGKSFRRELLHVSASTQGTSPPPSFLHTRVNPLGQRGDRAACPKGLNSRFQESFPPDMDHKNGAPSISKQLPESALEFSLFSKA